MDYLRCPWCEAVNPISFKYCYRCEQSIVLDIKRSLYKSIAFLIAAIIFYIPANIYPMLVSRTFASQKESTIIEGVIAMWQSGDYPVAVIIFVASIMIPFFKFLILIYLQLTISLKRCQSLKKHMMLYLLIELTGPWSMIDVFVVLILVGLFHFQNIAIIPGFGVTSFALMVFFTLLSSYSLDERILGVVCKKGRDG